MASNEVVQLVHARRRKIKDIESFWLKKISIKLRSWEGFFVSDKKLVKVGKNYFTVSQK